MTAAVLSAASPALCIAAVRRLSDIHPLADWKPQCQSCQPPAFGRMAGARVSHDVRVCCWTDDRSGFPIDGSRMVGMVGVWLPRLTAAGWWGWWVSGFPLKPKSLARQVVSRAPASATCRGPSWAGAAGAAAAVLRLTAAGWWGGWVSGFPEPCLMCFRRPIIAA